jgi:hypothetical protein
MAVNTAPRQQTFVEVLVGVSACQQILFPASADLQGALQRCCNSSRHLMMLNSSSAVYNYSWWV